MQSTQFSIYGLIFSCWVDKMTKLDSIYQYTAPTWYLTSILRKMNFPALYGNNFLAITSTEICKDTDISVNYNIDGRGFIQ